MMLNDEALTVCGLFRDTYIKPARVAKVDETLNRSTQVPPNVASPWQRLGAFLIDVMIEVFVILVPLGIFVYPAFPELRPVLVSSPTLYLIAGNIYGMTVGKRWLQIHIRRSGGRSPGLAAGLRRSTPLLFGLAFGALLRGVPTVQAVFAIVIMFGDAMLLWTEGHQSLWGRLAGTFVVRREISAEPTILL